MNVVTREIPPTAETFPPVSNSSDAEVDIQVMRSVPKQFRVEDDKSANWLIRKIVAARQYSQHVRGWAEQETRRAEREESTLLYLFGRQLEDWARSEIEKLNGKRKSVPLPAGTVGIRVAAAKLVIDDEKAVLLWAKENLPEAVVIVEKLSKSLINDCLTTTGVIPDAGVHMEPEAERFYIK